MKVSEIKSIIFPSNLFSHKKQTAAKKKCNLTPLSGLVVQYIESTLVVMELLMNETVGPLAVKNAFHPSLRPDQLRCSVVDKWAMMGEKKLTLCAL